jgi:aminoglycoside phosphotransferase
MVATDALDFLPHSWRQHLAGKVIVPVTAGMSGASVFRISGGDETNHYLKIGTGAVSDLVKREIERTDWLASVGVRVPEIAARLIEKDVVAVLMACLGSRTADHISHWQCLVLQIPFRTWPGLPAALLPPVIISRRMDRRRMAQGCFFAYRE